MPVLDSAAQGAEIAASDPPVWWWALGMVGWIVIACSLAGASGWGAVPSIAVTATGLAVGLTVYGPQRTRLRGQLLTRRTIWRRRDFDLRVATRAMALEQSKFSPGEIWVRFSDGSTWDITFRGRENILLAHKVVEVLDALGKSDVVEPSARRLPEVSRLSTAAEN